MEKAGIALRRPRWRTRSAKGELSAKPRLVLRFAVYTALALALAGVGIVLYVRHEVTERAESAVAFHTRFVANTIVRGNLRPADFSAPASGARLAELDALFRREVLVEGVVRVKLYRPDGTIVYSSDHSLIGTVERGEGFERALGGKAAHEVSRLNREGGSGPDLKVLEAYAPVRFDEWATPAGVFEVYQDYGPVARHIRSLVVPVALVLSVTLLALYAALFPILHQVTATLESRSRRLEEQAKELRTREERYRELFENANDMICTLDREGRFTAINRAGEAITGYPSAELLGRRFSELVLPENREGPGTDADAGIDGRASAGTQELQILASDGRRVGLEVNSRPISEGGRPVGLQMIARDVSERRELEAQLRQSQKMEAVGRLAGGIAHDFNNLLTAIQGYAEFLLAGLDGQTALQRDAEEVKKAAERASALTGQLLSFSRRELVRPRLVDLNDLVRGIETLLRRSLGEQIELRTLLSADAVRVEADPRQLEQVLLNLVVNARDAMPSGGALTIETASATLGEAYARRRDVSPGRHVCLALSDTGHGMSEETKRRAFEPFFTTKGPGQGTGLGLSTVYGIVEQAGGHLVLSSEEGVGTRVEVFLPASDGAVPRKEPYEAGEQASGNGGHETVLVVEDEEAVRKLAARILSEAGYEVLAAENATEALELSARHPDRIELLVSDVALPGLSGRELAQRLTALNPGLRVLYVSGYTDDTVLRHGVSERAVAFLEKPFRGAVLLARVREALEGRADSRAPDGP